MSGTFKRRERFRQSSHAHAGARYRLLRRETLTERLSAELLVRVRREAPRPGRSARDT